MKTFATMMIFLALTSTAAFANKDKDYHDKMMMKMSSMTPEQRQTMATAHEKMAVCLRSDKAVDECHKEMMQSCQSVMGEDTCPMMGHHGMGKKAKKGK